MVSHNTSISAMPRSRSPLRYRAPRGICFRRPAWVLMLSRSGGKTTVAIGIPGATTRFRRQPRLDDHGRPGLVLLWRDVDANQQRQNLRIVPAVPPGRVVGVDGIRIAAKITE